MSGKFVRASSFRHVFGTAAKKEAQFLDMKPEVNGQGNHIAANHKYFATAMSGGGGPLRITPLDAPGRQDRNPKKLSVHRGKVLDWQFNPFNSNMIGTVSEDCYAKVSVFPEGGLVDDVNEAVVTLEGHQKKIVQLAWHRTAANVMATASQDNMIKVWDIQKQAEIVSFDIPENPYSMDWNTNGSLLALTAKNKSVIICDPRQADAATSIECFTGSKQSSVRWMDNHNSIAAIGFTRQSMRVFHIYDPRNAAKALSTIDIDQSAGVLIPHYDSDNSILYMGGKGDAGVKYFEIVDDAPYAHFLAEFRTNTSQKGIAYVPKRAMNTKKCEVAVALRLMRDAVVPVSFCVPRKSDMFQKDIFPDSVDTTKATSDADAYAGGANGEPVFMSLNPKDRGDEVAAEEFVAQKSPAELKAELAAANARIKELEAEVARLKA